MGEKSIVNAGRRKVCRELDAGAVKMILTGKEEGEKVLEKGLACVLRPSS